MAPEIDSTFDKEIIEQQLPPARDIHGTTCHCCLPAATCHWLPGSQPNRKHSLLLRQDVKVFAAIMLA